ncbi:MAG: hypothetical protein H0U67_04210 [Gemmatimonadetes bacterium]|nr:hypothetical protein [Gemmatimonadota bacterium]
MSKVKIALGAASLFLFIVGVKRSYDGSDASEPDQAALEGGSTPTRKPRRKKGRPSDAE